MKNWNRTVLLIIAVCVFGCFARSVDAATVTWWYDVQVAGTRYLYNPGTGQVDQTPLTSSGLAKIEFDNSMRGGAVVIQTPVLGYTEGTKNGNKFTGERVYAGMLYKTTGTFNGDSITGNISVKDISKSGSKGHYEFSFHGNRVNP
ncbi:MAG: hypothetical protein Q7I97_07665 [Thermovirgaceae bacterium]|nr:hypothetical protein [Thermovirgaceae bacterium]